MQFTNKMNNNDSLLRKSVVRKACAYSTIVISLLTASCSSGSREISCSWRGENVTDSTYLQTFTIRGDLSEIRRLAFCQFATDMKSENPSDTVIELLPGYYAIGSSRFGNAENRDSITFSILTDGTMKWRSFVPDGMHAVMLDGTTVPVSIDFPELTTKPEYYGYGDKRTMPDASDIYDFNERVKAMPPKSPYDVVPSFKSVGIKEGYSTVNPLEMKFIDRQFGSPEEYMIEVSDNSITVSAPKRLHERLRKRLLHFWGVEPVTLPNAVITDFPDMEYRGLMVDVCRNFQSSREIRRVMDLMAVYGLNKLHFHLADDEGWRLEIPELPELTQVGSRRGYTESYDVPYLPQIYRGDGNPDSRTSVSNGYYTGGEFVELLRYADRLGIEVIPEIESPGHSRAAIYAMKWRAKKSGDRTMLLTEEGDTSRYSSAQYYHDNVVNPAMQGPYLLMEKVAQEIKKLYHEANVSLPAVHIGGDEVPHGAWNGSGLVAALMEKEGLADEHEVHAYFVKEVADVLEKQGLKIAGWSEIATGNSDAYNSALSPKVRFVNMWHPTGNIDQQRDLAHGGYPVVIGNVDKFYLDMSYNGHPMEKGLCWGGNVNEYVVFGGYPKDIVANDSLKVAGMSGHLWAETINGPSDLERMLLPKMLGLAERAWNNDSTYSEREFTGLAEHEMKGWDRSRLVYHVNAPGIRLDRTGRRVVMNAPYRDCVIRYTLDGTIPDVGSPVYTGGTVAFGNASEVRARLWVNGKPSQTTLLKLK